MIILFKNHKLLLALTVFFSLLLSVVSVSVAFLLEALLNAVAFQDSRAFLSILAFVPILLLVTGSILTVTGICTKKLTASITREMRTNLYQGIMSRDPSRFHSVNTAEYISVLSNDIKTIEEHGVLPFLQILQYIMIFALTSAALMYYSFAITGLLFLCLILMYLIPSAFGKALGRRQESMTGSLSMFTSHIKDHLSGYDIIRSFQMTSHTGTIFEGKNLELTGSKYALEKMASISEGIAQTLAVGTQLLIMLVSASLILKGHMAAGALLALTELSGSFIQPVAIIMQNIPLIQGVKPVLERYIKYSTNSDPEFSGRKPPVFHNCIKISSLSFGYTKDQAVLNQADLTFEKNGKYVL